ncbi:unnamed protein product [Prorocentrum cordatum]|uniref:Uncharacterized protein n=1 Tax=Prorocentrum cordatum TaxID=2364126 RepID=A0ABN9S3T2_9DINO|nr:unnamed protein product [Polarella glacialis]
MRDIAAAFEEVATFPSQEGAATPVAASPPKSAHGKGKSASPVPPFKRLCGPGAPIVVPDAEWEDCSEPYIKQACLQVFESFKAALTTEIAAKISQDAADSNNKLLAMVDALRSEVAKKSEDDDDDCERVLGIVRPEVDGVHRRLQQQVDSTNARLAAAEGRLDAHDKELQALKDEMGRLRHLFAVAEQRPAAPPPILAGLDRDVGPSIVHAIAQRPTSLAGDKTSLQQFALDSGFQAEEFEIQALGPLPSERFAVQFLGLAAPVARRAAKLLGCLKKRGGTWHGFSASRGANSQCRSRLGPYNGPKQIRLEVTLPRVRQALAVAHPRGEIFMDKERGTLSAVWSCIARVSVSPGNRAPQTHWGPSNLAKIGWDKQRCLDDPESRFALVNGDFIFSDTDSAQPSAPVDSEAIIGRVFVSMPSWLACQHLALS